MSANRQFILGVFFIAALSILAFYTLFLTDFSLFHTPIQIAADFPEAHDLRTGDPVLVAGKRIGRVGSIDYEPTASEARRIRVVMNLDEEVLIRAGYRIAIRESTLLGGRKIDINPGPAGAVVMELEEGEAYAGVVERNPIAALQDVANIFADNAEALAGFLRSMDSILSEVRQGRGTVGRLVYDQEMAANIAGAAADLRTAAASMERITGRIDSGEGTLGRLLQDDALYPNLLAATEDLSAMTADLRDGRGTLGRLLREEAMADELAAAIRDVRELTASLKGGEGILGRMITDGELATRLERIVSNAEIASENLRDLSGSIRNGEGSLGKLIQESDLYDETMVAIRLLTRSLEDYREAAPVSAFTSVLFQGL